MPLTRDQLAGVRRVLVVGALALALAPSASAHAILVASSPANGAVVASAPASVRVTFNSTVKVGPGTEAVRDNGTSVLGGAPSVTGAGAITLVIPLRSKLPAGDYTVRWSIVSEIDGHQQQGVIAFAVGTGSAPPVAALSAEGFVTWKSVLIRTLFYLGILGAVGVVFFAAVVLRPLGLEHELIERQARVLSVWFVVALGGCVALLATLSVGGTNFARYVAVATVASAAGGVAAGLTPRYPRLRYGAWIAAAVLLVCPTLSGHAFDVTQPRVLAPLVDVLHLGAAGVWLGGLSSLAFVVAPLPDRLRTRVVRRFSALALAAVAVIAVTGLSRALTELSSVRQVWSTSYGDALIVKSALFAVLICLGWFNRSRLLGAFGQLRRSVLAEIALLAGVIVAVGALTDLPPGRDAVAQPNPPAPLIQQPPLPQKGAFTEAQQAGPYAVGLSVAAGKAIVTVIGPEGTAPSGVTVTIDHRTTTATCGPGCYTSAASGRNVSVQLHGQQLRFQIPARLESAAELLQRATRAFTSLRELLIRQVLSSAPGLVQVTQFRERAPDKLSYVISKDSQRTAVGTAAIAIGTHRWDRSPAGHWVESKQASSKIPSPWWGPESRNAYLVAPNEIAFFDPRIPAWFRLYLNPAGEPVRLGMIAAAHFMTEYYSGLDKPITVTPP